MFRNYKGEVTKCQDTKEQGMSACFHKRQTYSLAGMGHQKNTAASKSTPTLTGCLGERCEPLQNNQKSCITI